MKKLLEQFFGRILGLEISVQEATPQLFICKGVALKNLEYQQDIVSNMLEMYGLSQVVTADYRSDPPTLVVDFGAKWHDSIERSSYKFLENNTSHWDQSVLNVYAQVIDDLGLKHAHQKLASHLLLLYNFKTKPPRKIECIAERGGAGSFLTFPENGTSTVFYNQEKKTELVHVGPSSFTALALCPSILDQFKLTKLREAHYTVQNGYIVVNDQGFTTNQLEKIHKISMSVASSNNVHGKVAGLRKILKTFESIKVEIP